MKVSPHHLEFFLRETFINIRRNGMMSVAAVSTVLIGLCLLGAMYLATVNLNLWAGQLAQQVEIYVPLQDGLSAQDLQAARQRIEQLPGVESVQFVSRHQEWQELQQQLGRQMDLADFESNPLSDSFDVRVASPEQVPATAALIKQIHGVDKEHVDFGGPLMNKVLALRRVVWLVGGAAVILLGLATLLIVGNTIRLTVLARQREIRLMQLLGATDAFICVPFVLEGVFHGVVGAALAGAVLTASYQALVRWLSASLPFLPLAHAEGLKGLWVLLLFAGVAFGLAGSVISLRRFLAVCEPS
ncbi:MAG: permease-like cell division protein FtsX [Abditibacteriales bacterium]|nr:permease-like cell division protein FtsX [Abditibacteriales bacterium]MDW8365926.1 permease-like cell division protein FtsX [Abditibacteriales bacterium]